MRSMPMLLLVFAQENKQLNEHTKKKRKEGTKKRKKKEWMKSRENKGEKNKGKTWKFA